MAVTRRIFFSKPGDMWLSAEQNQLKWRIVEEVEKFLDNKTDIGPIKELLGRFVNNL